MPRGLLNEHEQNVLNRLLKQGPQGITELLEKLEKTASDKIEEFKVSSKGYSASLDAAYQNLVAVAEKLDDTQLVRSLLNSVGIDKIKLFLVGKPDRNPCPSQLRDNENLQAAIGYSFVDMRFVPSILYFVEKEGYDNPLDLAQTVGSASEFEKQLELAGLHLEEDGLGKITPENILYLFHISLSALQVLPDGKAKMGY